RISLQCFFKNNKRPAQIFFIEHVSHPYFLLSLAFGDIKTASRSEHYCFILIAKIFEQPLAKLVGIVYGELRHAVKCSAWFWAKNARNFIESVNQKIAATGVFFYHIVKI